MGTKGKEFRCSPQGSHGAATEQPHFPTVPGTLAFSRALGPPLAFHSMLKPKSFKIQLSYTEATGHLVFFLNMRWQLSLFWLPLIHLLLLWVRAPGAGRLAWVGHLSFSRGGTQDPNLTHQKWAVTQAGWISASPRAHAGGIRLVALSFVGTQPGRTGAQIAAKGRTRARPTARGPSPQGDQLRPRGVTPAPAGPCIGAFLNIVLRLFNNRPQPLADASLSWVSLTRKWEEP